MVPTKQIDLSLDPVCPTKELTVEDGSGSGSQHHSNHDDEVEEVKGESAFGFIMRRREKSRLKMFRGMVAAMLAMTAGVTLVAFFFLKREETRKFETAVSTTVSPCCYFFLVYFILSILSLMVLTSMSSSQGPWRMLRLTNKKTSANP